MDDPPEFYIPKEWRGKPINKKQGSDGVVDLNDFDYLDGETTVTFKDTVDNLPKSISAIYEDLIMIGVAPEMARMILPQNMMTSWYWSGSLDAFANMANLRLKPDAQYETRLVAEQISEKMEELFPIAWRALVK